MAGNRSTENKKHGLSGLFNRNGFVFAFSVLVSVIIWFVMASENSERNKVVYDVPIQISLSAGAESEGIRVFNQTYTTADIEISGSSLITSSLSADDFQVTAQLNPTSTKLTGNTMQKDTITVRASKLNSVSDYQIVSVSPEEIVVEYDRYKESTFTIDRNFKYSTDSGYVAEDPVLSAESVTVSGPESSVNKISRVEVEYSVSDALKDDVSFTCPIKLYDQNNQEITDTSGLYLEMDITTVDVSISVLSQKTVDIVATTLHQPSGFTSSRITVEPSQIIIAGEEDVLSGINEITLDTAIDFADLDFSSTNTFTMDIPLPAGVKNITSSGDSILTQATVTINLNGYKTAALAVESDNFLISNQPAGKDVELNTLELEVNVAGSEAQVSKLTGDSISVLLDLSNFSDVTGTVSVPATISITGSGSDSCWSLGKYTVKLTISEQTTETDTEGSSDT